VEANDYASSASIAQGLARAYQKTLITKKQIIDTIAETEKTTRPTSGAIADTWKSRTGVQIGEKDLLQNSRKQRKRA
jgi:hypothetical protein